ncbi:MAG: exonuclease SbcCD subunit D C-terminal domain-containing protein [Sulfurimonas sp.]|nr:exonuclease SbcCD subunit D C-terminal domain-containing protein [Sulfurimonas sp.]
MKILHTSDWHLGQSFKAHSREFEHRSFLEWLVEEIEEKNIDVLIVAGDIFDTSNPPNYALKMYHNFLAKMIKTNCKDIVIVAGNHDSVSTLEVSKDLLKSLNVHVVASGEDTDEVLVKIEKDSKLKAIVCAVPYLRDRVLRNANDSKTSSEVEDELRDGIKNYYKNIYNKAKELSDSVPIIATGHFTTTGASISPDSEREIYIGKLQNIDAQMLSSFDYVAMGHIHKPQKITKNDAMQYSGSPIPLSFSETNNQKSVVIVDIEDGEQSVTLSKIPLFKELHRLKGSFADIREKIENISNIDNPPFVEVVVQGEDILNYDINEFLRASSSNGVEILMLKREYEVEDKVLNIEDEKLTLSELDPLDIFDKRLQSEQNVDYSQEMQQTLQTLYSEVLKECQNENN